ncbi:MAG: Fic family protein [Chitinispirillaceae bacterium]
MFDNFVLKLLPPNYDLETKAVLKQAVRAGRALAELKGVSKTIPNQAILINTLPLLEAKNSSEVENIITTQDDIYKEELFRNEARNAAAKEVSAYGMALRHGYDTVIKTGLLTNNQLLDIQAMIEKNRAGFRRLPGTDLKDSYGNTVYTPPQNHQDILALVANLEKVINEPSFLEIDPLIKMAIIHYQFESIHPFYDGNGRTGRILNILYLVKEGLLDLPVLYLSRYIIRTKGDYYRCLQNVRVSAAWEEWLLYVLKGVEETAVFTTKLISDMRSLMQDYKLRIRSELNNIYSQDLLNSLFRHPYTTIDNLSREINKSRQTASKYLDMLVTGGFLKKDRFGKQNIYINEALYQLFLGAE